MNDDQKTKEQLLEELQRERERSELAEERSLSLQEVSKKVAAVHDTDEVLELIVNEAARMSSQPDVKSPKSTPRPTVFCTSQTRPPIGCQSQNMAIMSTLEKST